MEDRRGSAPGVALQTGPHAVAELYPRAGILTAWLNAIEAGAVDGLAECPAIRPDEPFHAEAAGAPAWNRLTLTVGEALACRAADPALPAGPARCALPVPGDVGGLPSGCPGALSVGQAMIVSDLTSSVVVWPVGRGWHAVRADPIPTYSDDVRSARLRVMTELATAVTVLEDATLPTARRSELNRRLVDLEVVPLPPGSAPAAVELARSSARLLAICDVVLAGQTDRTAAATALHTTLDPLGRVGRAALATAFSMAAR